MIDPVWEQKYVDGFEQRYPWDSVVSFIYRYSRSDVDRANIRVLEVGFGCGSNLWFAAREGFAVFGIEASETAVSYAKRRFTEEGLDGDLLQGDFTTLPFSSNYFDLVIDRAALTHVGKSEHQKAIAEIHRVLKPGGYFHYNAYAESHSSNAGGVVGAGDVRFNIEQGSLQGVGQVYFPSKADVDSLFLKGWRVNALQLREFCDLLASKTMVHSDWLVIAEKVL